MADQAQREVILEYTQFGSALKVTAVDTATGTEVSFQAHPKTGPEEIRRLALAKLTYVINKAKKDEV